MKILVLLAVLLSLTITTARFLDENVSVMVFNRDLYLALKMLMDRSAPELSGEKAGDPMFSFAIYFLSQPSG